VHPVANHQVDSYIQASHRELLVGCKGCFKDQSFCHCINEIAGQLFLFSSKLHPFSWDFMPRHINAPTNHVANLLENRLTRKPHLSPLKKATGHRPFPTLSPPESALKPLFKQREIPPMCE
jgi:hypothetical protein